MNNAYGLLEVQEANLRILKEIDRICEKFRIGYVLDSGTLLGAIRHGGFIPWDDDADVVMTRNAWEAFRKVAPRELPEGMSLLLPDTFAGGSRFYDFTPRIIYEFSRRRKPDGETAFYEEKLNHLWVDIFILDRLPDNPAAAKSLILRHKALYLLAMGHRQKLDMKKYTAVQKLPVFGGSTAGKAVSMRAVFGLQDRLAKKYNKKKTARWYYSNYDPGYIDIKLKDEWVTERIRIRFEDTTLSIPAHYDEVLTCIYGDYMKLPPKEQRVPSHGSTEIQIYG
jgi:lipopolysaccharide cholinephosphotransferase